MQIKRYEVANVQEAISKIKKELGPDAIILSTKKIKSAGGPMLEVLAARELDLTEASQDHRSYTGVNEPENDGGTSSADLAPVLSKNFDELKRLLEDLKSDRDVRTELAEVKDSINIFFDVLGLKRNRTGKNSTDSIYYSLISKGISKEKAWGAVEKIKNKFEDGQIENSGAGLAAVENLIQKSLPAIHGVDKRQRVKVLIGPTGVGKTTTLAKLSAYHALNEKKSVGLITTDTYRIAAVEQLKIYARIIGIPLEIAPGNKDFKKSLSRFADKDVIFVDTPGTSRNDMTNLRKLQETLSSELPFESNLLLSLTSSKECMMDVATRYKIFDYNQIILTRADECMSIGFLWDILDRIAKPVSYITNGQNVPNDIEEANPQKIARLIVGRDLH
jgi:flagellar biosynthesis protein FlhF